MRSYEEYLNEPVPRTGRNNGTRIANKVDDVYRLLRRDKHTSLSLKDFRKVLNTVADKFWGKVYDGHSVAVPFLCNFEVQPSTSMFVKSVDWKRTHELWKHDEEAYNDRLLVRNTPLRYRLRIKHSTLSFSRKYWYLSMMMKIRPSKSRAKLIEQKYALL